MLKLYIYKLEEKKGEKKKETKNVIKTDISKRF